MPFGLFFSSSMLCRLWLAKSRYYSCFTELCPSILSKAAGKSAGFVDNAALLAWQHVGQLRQHVLCKQSILHTAASRVPCAAPAQHLA